MGVRQEETDGKENLSEVLTFEVWWDVNNEKYPAMERYNENSARRRNSEDRGSAGFLS